MLEMALAMTFWGLYFTVEGIHWVHYGWIFFALCVLQFASHFHKGLSCSLVLFYHWLARGARLVQKGGGTSLRSRQSITHWEAESQTKNKDSLYQASPPFCLHPGEPNGILKNIVDATRWKLSSGNLSWDISGVLYHHCWLPRWDPMMQGINWSSSKESYEGSGHGTGFEKHWHLGSPESSNDLTWSKPGQHPSFAQWFSIKNWLEIYYKQS